MSASLPTPTFDFAIIGAQKSGSTLVHEHLASHPGVWMPVGEQPHLEDPHYGQPALAALARDLEAAPAGARVGIKRPDYLARPEVPPRLHDIAPRARLLVALRDPVERAVSAFVHYRHYGLVPDVRVNDGLRMILRGGVPHAYARASEVLEFGRYGVHLRRWTSTFDSRQILVVHSDALRRDSAKELARVQSFLGLAAVEARSAGLGNPGPYSQVRRTYMRVVRRLVCLDHTSGATGLAQSPVGRRALAFDDGWLAQRFRGRPETLDDDVSAELVEYYAADRADLEETLATTAA
jgi:hypothetical protein